MSYDKINYKKLKSSFNSIDNISNSKITNLKGDILKSEWDSPICDRVKTAIVSLEKEYLNLKKKISNYKKTLPYIETYQDAKNKYDEYSNKENQNYKDYLEYRSKYNEAVDDDALKPAYKIKMEYHCNKYNDYKTKKNTAKKSMLAAEKNINMYIK